MANRWENGGNSDRLYFGGLRNHCRWWLHEIKRCLLLRRKVMTNLDSTLKSRDITLLTKVHLVKAMVFPAVMYGCESWTIKKLSAGELMLLNCGWRRLLQVPWTARRSNQSILKESSPEYSLEGLMLKLTSSLSAIKVVSSAYLSLLIFLPRSWFQLVLHPAQCFSWCTLYIS